MAMLIPKPPASASAAASRTNAQICKQVTYNAQANETIYGIAIKYGISKETIANANGLTTDKLDAPQTLIIPLCQNTPVETPTVPNTLTLPSDNPSPRG
jgi:LysM repeat protein